MGKIVEHACYHGAMESMENDTKPKEDKLGEEEEQMRAGGALEEEEKVPVKDPDDEEKSLKNVIEQDLI
jgi:hypothetical protein